MKQQQTTRGRLKTCPTLTGLPTSQSLAAQASVIGPQPSNRLCILSDKTPETCPTKVEISRETDDPAAAVVASRSSKPIAGASVMKTKEISSESERREHYDETDLSDKSP